MKHDNIYYLQIKQFMCWWDLGGMLETDNLAQTDSRRNLIIS